MELQITLVHGMRELVEAFEAVKNRARIRLWLNDSFVDIYCNTENEIISMPTLKVEKGFSERTTCV